MEYSRKKKSIKNIIFAVVSNFLIYFLSLFTSKVIKENLGLQVLGLNGVLSNVISILSLSEMGIGTAITFALYKPLAENNKGLIKSIMQFYKKAYKIVAITVAALGILLFPFIPIFLKDSSFSKYYIYIVYSLFLLNSILSYLLVYKRTLILADQKNYIISSVTLVYSFILKISQLLVVYFTSNYILFLLIQILCTLIYNLSISKICDKLYPYLKEKAGKITKEVYQTIISKIKALIFHSLGTVIVFGTDNILISYFCGVSEAGKYTSYLSIINMIGTFISLIFDNIKDSIGNFLVTETQENKYILFNRLYYLNQSLVSICSICLYLLLTPFITLLLGEDTIFNNIIVLTIVFNFYISKSSIAIGSFKNSAGLFEQDKYVPIYESIINLVASVIFARYFGVTGIVLGTILSTLLGPFIFQPFIVYKNIFNKSALIYFFNYIVNLIKTLVIYFVIYILFEIFNLRPISNYFVFFIRAGLIFILATILWIILSFWKKEFKYFNSFILKKLRGI